MVEPAFERSFAAVCKQCRRVYECKLADRHGVSRGDVKLDRVVELALGDALRRRDLSQVNDLVTELALGAFEQQLAQQRMQLPARARPRHDEATAASELGERRRRARAAE